MIQNNNKSINNKWAIETDEFISESTWIQTSSMLLLLLLLGHQIMRIASLLRLQRAQRRRVTRGAVSVGATPRRRRRRIRMTFASSAARLGRQVGSVRAVYLDLLVPRVLRIVITITCKHKSYKLVKRAGEGGGDESIRFWIELLNYF